MAKITKLTVGKGVSNESPDQKGWTRLYYEVEIALEDASELEVARANALGTLDAWLTGIAKPAPATAPPNIFPKELADMLSFEEKLDAIIIKPKAYLGSENFNKVLAIVKKHNGSYKSAGKESHFMIPKAK